MPLQVGIEEGSR